MVNSGPVLWQQILSAVALSILSAVTEKQEYIFHHKKPWNHKIECIYEGVNFLFLSSVLQLLFVCYHCRLKLWLTMCAQSIGQGLGKTHNEVKGLQCLKTIGNKNVKDEHVISVHPENVLLQPHPSMFYHSIISVAWMLGGFPDVSGQRRDSTTVKSTSALARASWRKRNHSPTFTSTSLRGRKPKYISHKQCGKYTNFLVIKNPNLQPFHPFFDLWERPL